MNRSLFEWWIRMKVRRITNLGATWVSVAFDESTWTVRARPGWGEVLFSTSPRLTRALREVEERMRGAYPYPLI